MNVFLVRLALDFLAVALIVACLAYWWLDNLSHELFGTVLFALVILHNIFNRRWYGGVTKRKLDAIRIVNLVTIICLAIGMTVMLVTSLLVSRDLFPFTALSGAFAVREIHMFAGYWILLIIAVHLGTRWEVVMNVLRATFGARGPMPVRAWASRILTFGIVGWGMMSFSEMAFGAKLMLTYSLDMWDFNESVLGFFLNYGSIVGMFAAAAHYALAAIRYLTSPLPNQRND
ncbi:DUF4405 domain-containing protein [Agrobacterium fabrum]|uniref:DUF4405 domain-containing protein n=1 Tax=Agrobacterium fabrum TaxID=1176649 RepID=UPI002158127A|nr:DUF4405 domain-containing protein [Agrobacterium fabrum]MCR6727755.1 DUF4405 domain-containing protein [Agrobacterium fabrum]